MAARTATLRLYRILQRKCLELKKQQKQLQKLSTDSSVFLLQPPLDPHQAGGSRILKNQSDPVTSKESIFRLLPLWDEEYDPDFEDWLNAVSVINGKEVDESDDDDDSLEHEEEIDTMWVSVSGIQDAIRHAFRHSPADSEKETLYNKWAIRAYQILNEQEGIQRLTSVSKDDKETVRIVATSRCIGRSLTSKTGDERGSYRFAYRIRIENISQSDTFQLLGRTWTIQETPQHEDIPMPEAIRVHAPNTGAVGKLPVLHPKEAFEYMSGCELATETGHMKGYFHFAPVSPDTESAIVGMHIDAFDSKERFEVTVKPFPLRADEDMVVFHK